MKSNDAGKSTSFWNKKFRYTEMGSSLKTEVIAGLTTFLAMAYILVVNSGMFATLGSVSFDAMYVTTALSAIIGSVLIGLLSNLPLAQAPGMGLNAFFVYTVCLTLGFSYANALVFVLIDGLIFIMLTATGLRKIIFDAIPPVVKAAIPAGIGLFIAFWDCRTQSWLFRASQPALRWLRLIFSVMQAGLQLCRLSSRYFHFCLLQFYLTGKLRALFFGEYSAERDFIIFSD